MSPIRNRHQSLVTVLFTVGLGVFLVGALTGLRAGQGFVKLSLAGVERARPGGVDKVGDARMGIVKEEAIEFERWNEVGKLNASKGVFEAGGMVRVHRSPLKHQRHRSGSDLFFTSFRDSSVFPAMARLRVFHPAGFCVAVQATPSLRGPPCA